MYRQLIQRILDISYRHRLAHLGSNLAALPVIYDIYSKMGKDDRFILSCGHSGLALYVVLEHFRGLNADTLFEKHGVHPHMDKDIYCSTGSLGWGITIATGAALVSPRVQFHCLLSDGECAEGSVWESLAFIRQHKLENLKVYVHVNGYAAYDVVDRDYLVKRLQAFLPSIIVIPTNSQCFPFLIGLNAHYHIMSKEDYEHATTLNHA